MRPTTVLRGVAVARIAIGVTLTLGTRRVLSVMLRDEEPSDSYVLFARTVGIRDALFGLGCLLAILRDEDSPDARRWLQLWLANEAADVVAAVAASRKLGPAGAAVAAAPPMAFVAADAWVLRNLGRPATQTSV